MPAAGYRDYSDGTLYYVGSHGDYWSSTAYSDDSAYYLGFSSGTAGWNWSIGYYGGDGRDYGFSVRPVAEN